MGLGAAYDPSLKAGRNIQVDPSTGLPLSVAATTTPAAVTATAVSAGASIGADQNAVLAATVGLRLFGYSVREDAGATAVVQIMHGATVGGGVLVETISLGPLESTADYWGPEGVAVPNGVSIDWVSGSLKMSLKSKVVV
jgi:hypothetical protein